MKLAGGRPRMKPAGGRPISPAPTRPSRPSSRPVPPVRPSRQPRWAPVRYRPSPGNGFPKIGTNRPVRPGFGRYLEPWIRGKQCLGSSNGWLVITDEVAELQLLNPFTGSTASLPSITTLSYIEKAERDQNNDRITGYMYRYRGKPILTDLDYMRNCYSAKVIYFPSASMAVAIQAVWETLTFARLGDDSWTDLKTKQSHFEDFVFHKGKLFAVTVAGVVCVFDLGNGNPSSPPAISMFGPPSPTLNDHKHYLVESLDGDLLHVCRLTDQDITESFKIFKLDPSSLQRSQVKSLGAGTALFLGHNHSMSISTRDSHLKGNCIYFTDDDRSNFTTTPHARRNMGVCDLEDGTIAPLFPSHSRLLHLTWPPPIWITPTLS